MDEESKSATATTVTVDEPVMDDATSMATESPQAGDEAKPAKKRCTRRCCCISTVVSLLLLLAATGVLIWYFFFDEETPDPVATCGDCHCIVDSDDNDATCPTNVPRTNFTQEEINIWNSQKPLNAYELDCNPYTDDNCETNPPMDLQADFWQSEQAVCALHFDSVDETEGIDDTKNITTAPTATPFFNGEFAKRCKFAEYRLQSYASREEAELAGGFVTHEGPCGVCSTMQDLAAYVQSTDLTTEGKVCGKQAAISLDIGRECYEGLGMTPSCAKLWSFNSWNTATDCVRQCLFNGAFQDLPNNGPPPQCKLNECLQCDETKSGPLFKQFGGRTRRSSGLLSAIARPCSDLVPIAQEVCPETRPLQAN